MIFFFLAVFGLALGQTVCRSKGTCSACVRAQASCGYCAQLGRCERFDRVENASARLWCGGTGAAPRVDESQCDADPCNDVQHAAACAECAATLGCVWCEDKSATAAAVFPRCLRATDASCLAPAVRVASPSQCLQLLPTITAAARTTSLTSSAVVVMLTTSLGGSAVDETSEGPFPTSSVAASLLQDDRVVVAAVSTAAVLFVAVVAALACLIFRRNQLRKRNLRAVVESARGEPRVQVKNIAYDPAATSVIAPVAVAQKTLLRVASTTPIDDRPALKYSFDSDRPAFDSAVNSGRIDDGAPLPSYDVAPPVYDVVPEAEQPAFT